jgi:hypothetical protein
MFASSSHDRSMLQPLLDSVLALQTPALRRYWLADLRADCPRITRDLEALLRTADALGDDDVEIGTMPQPGSLEALGLRC